MVLMNAECFTEDSWTATLISESTALPLPLLGCPQDLLRGLGQASCCQEGTPAPHRPAAYSPPALLWELERG